jgi:hypothetical protein
VGRLPNYTLDKVELAPKIDPAVFKKPPAP